jgi:hypothetical protein
MIRTVAGSSASVAENGKGVTRARQNGVPRRAETLLARFAGSVQANRRTAPAHLGLIGAVTGHTIIAGTQMGNPRSQFRLAANFFDFELCVARERGESCWCCVCECDSDPANSHRSRDSQPTLSHTLVQVV